MGGILTKGSKSDFKVIQIERKKSFEIKNLF
jgi:hypothetical protein